MYNWSTNVKSLSKNKEKLAAWQLEQQVNFGLDGKKLNVRLLKKYWHQLELDPARKAYIKLLLDEK